MQAAKWQNLESFLLWSLIDEQPHNAPVGSQRQLELGLIGLIHHAGREARAFHHQAVRLHRVCFAFLPPQALAEGRVGAFLQKHSIVAQSTLC